MARPPLPPLQHRPVTYYNEHDPKAAAWIRALIDAGHLPAGHVDTRDIRLVQPTDLLGYTQCHFFAGIGGWALALRLAGVPDDFPVWTGSCPCQPFSVAGKRHGTKDPRHLWPHFRRLIRRCRPPVVFGEQVASADGRDWLSGVFADLEALAYLPAGADLCAASVGQEAEGWMLRGDTAEWEPVILSAPHIRQRLWWVARGMADYASHKRERQQNTAKTPNGGLEHQGLGRQQWRPESVGRRVECGCSNGRTDSRLGHPTGDDQCRAGQSRALHGRLGTSGGSGSGSDGGLGLPDSAGHGHSVVPAGDHGGLADADQGQCGQLTAGQGCQRHRPPSGRQQSDGQPECNCANGRLADAPNLRGTQQQHQPRAGSWRPSTSPDAAKCAGSDCWSVFDLIPCRDGKTRRIESGTFPLAHGIPGRVGLLRGYGNAIVPQVAAEFIQASLEALETCPNL